MSRRVPSKSAARMKHVEPIFRLVPTMPHLLDRLIKVSCSAWPDGARYVDAGMTEHREEHGGAHCLRVKDARTASRSSPND